MTFNDYLLDDDRYKLYLLEYIEATADSEILISTLCDFIGLSKFKTIKLLNSLMIDLINYPTLILLITQQNTIHCEHMTLEIIRQQRLNYLKKSPIFLILHETIQNTFSMRMFAQKHFLGQTAAYQAKKDLNRILKTQNIKLKNKTIIGDELSIRAYLFELYYYFFNGFEFPFSGRILNHTQQTMQTIPNLDISMLALTQRIKLELFLAIQYLRIHNDNELNSPATTAINNDTFSTKSELSNQYISQHFTSKNNFSFELQYLELNLFVNRLTSDSKVHYHILPESMTAKLNIAFFKYLEKEIQFKDDYLFSKTCREWQKLNISITNIHLLLELSHFTASSFISANQIHYFEENYPVFHKITKKFLTNHIFKIYPHLSDEKKVGLFYDYMFALIAALPYRLVDHPTYICVDFSNGPDYTQFITSTIESFKDLNLIIQAIPSSKTDLYISDFSIQSLTCTQIIWKNPPSANDWEHFANSILKIKDGGL